MTADPALTNNLEQLANAAFEIGASAFFIVREPKDLTVKTKAHGTVIANQFDQTAVVILFPQSAPGGVEEDVEMITPETLGERSIV